jgi:hypothetical protein
VYNLRLVFEPWPTRKPVHISRKITMSAQPRRPRLAFALLGALVLAACGGDSPVEPMDTPGEAVGTYSLQSVGGATLPLLIYEDEEIAVSLVGGSVVLSGDWTFREAFEFMESPIEGDDEEIVQEIMGTYSIAGGVIIFLAGDIGWEGVLSEGSISYSLNAVALTFER